MKQLLASATIIILLFAAALLIVAQQAPSFSKERNPPKTQFQFPSSITTQVPGEAGEPDLERRIKRLEDLTQKQSDVINLLAEEVKVLRKDVDECKRTAPNH